jgi:hypothetical protein
MPGHKAPMPAPAVGALRSRPRQAQPGRDRVRNALPRFAVASFLPGREAINPPWQNETRRRYTRSGVADFSYSTRSGGPTSLQSLVHESKIFASARRRDPSCCLRLAGPTAARIQVGKGATRTSRHKYPSYEAVSGAMNSFSIVCIGRKSRFTVSGKAINPNTL